VVLSRVFNLFPETILLVSEDGYVELPDEDGYFVAVDDLPTWTVTGDSMAPAPAALPSTNMTTPYSYQPPLAAGRKNRGRKWSPMYRTSLFQDQKPPGVRAQEADDYVGTSSGSARSARGNRSVQLSATDSDNWRKYIEVCKWSDREKQWKKVSNLPLTINESTANVKSVAGMVAADAFNGEAAVILDNEYLQIPDTANTMGECEVFLVLAGARLSFFFGT